MKYGFSPVLLLSAFMIGPQSHAPSKVLLVKGMTLNLYDNLFFFFFWAQTLLLWLTNPLAIPVNSFGH